LLIPLKLFFIWFWHQIQKPYKTTKTQGGRKLCLPLTLVDTASGRLFNLLLEEESRYQVYETKRHILWNMINTNRQILWYRETPVNDQAVTPYLKMGLIFVIIPLLFILANLTLIIDCVDSLCCPFFRFYGLLEINLLSHKKSNLFESSHSEFIPFSISIWPFLTWIPIVWFPWKTTTLV